MYNKLQDLILLVLFKFVTRFLSSPFLCNHLPIQNNLSITMNVPEIKLHKNVAKPATGVPTAVKLPTSCG
jgi:hypothetical protein